MMHSIEMHDYIGIYSPRMDMIMMISLTTEGKHYYYNSLIGH